MAEPVTAGSALGAFHLVGESVGHQRQRAYDGCQGDEDAQQDVGDPAEFQPQQCRGPLVDRGQDGIGRGVAGGTTAGEAGVGELVEEPFEQRVELCELEDKRAAG